MQQIKQHQERSTNSNCNSTKIEKQGVLTQSTSRYYKNKSSSTQNNSPEINSYELQINFVLGGRLDPNAAGVVRIEFDHPFLVPGHEVEGK